MPKSKKLLKFILVFSLLLIVFIPRFWNFWTVDFTGDEATHVKKSVSVAVGIKSLLTFKNPEVAFKNIYVPVLEHNHPPLEFLVLIPFGLIEPREFFARLVYVLIGSFAVIISYFFAKKVFGRKIAGYFFVFFGTSAYVIWWSQTAIYVSLAISAGVFIALSIVNFYKNPNAKSLIILTVFEILGLLVFLDFIFFLPSIIWMAWGKRESIKFFDFRIPAILFLTTAGVFYFSYIIYAFTVEPKYAGFNYVLNAKLSAHANIANNIKGYWNNFFGYRGVLILLPFAVLVGFSSKGYKFFKYLYLVIFIYLAVFIIKSPSPFDYFASTMGIFLLLAALGIGTIADRLRPIVITLVIIINFYSLLPIFEGKHNPQLFDNSAPNNARAISLIAKKCLTADNETYISTDDPWKMTYYFGKQSTLERDGTEARVATIGDFLDGRLSEVVLIHVRNDLIGSEEHNELKSRATKVLDFDRETVYLFKNCV